MEWLQQQDVYKQLNLFGEVYESKSEYVEEIKIKIL